MIYKAGTCFFFVGLSSYDIKSVLMQSQKVRYWQKTSFGEKNAEIRQKKAEVAHRSVSWAIMIMSNT